MAGRPFTRLAPTNRRMVMIPFPALVAAADASDAKRNEANQRLLWAGLLLVAILLVGALFLAWLERWRKRMTQESATGIDQLTAFRLSYERGEISEEEYRRIRMRLGGKQPNIVEPKIAPPAEQTPAGELTPND